MTIQKPDIPTAEFPRTPPVRLYFTGLRRAGAAHIIATTPLAVTALVELESTADELVVTFTDPDGLPSGEKVLCDVLASIVDYDTVALSDVETDLDLPSRASVAVGLSIAWGLRVPVAWPHAGLRPSQIAKVPQ